MIRDTPGELAFRAEARVWLEANYSAPLSQEDQGDEFIRLLAWEKLLFRDGWSVLNWPVEYGGRGATLREWLIFEEEYFRVNAPPRISQNGISLLAPTLFAYGTNEQKARVLPRMAASEDIWAQGWSEPGAGSDLAALSSRAERDPSGTGWRVWGQKTWTTRGSWCTHLFGLFRSDTNSNRHRGLTYLMLDLRSPGVTVRPFGRLDGRQDFADIFFDDVFVPDDDVIGEPNHGWEVAMVTTGSERGTSLRSPARYIEQVRRLAELIGSTPGESHTKFRRELADVWIDTQAYRAFTLRQAARIESGQALGSESSMNKVFWSEMDVRITDLAMRVLGKESLVESEWTTAYQFALGGTIYAGTNEIQRNIIGERILGLPRG